MVTATSERAMLSERLRGEFANNGNSVGDAARKVAESASDDEIVEWFRICGSHALYAEGTQWLSGQRRSRPDPGPYSEVIEGERREFALSFLMTFYSVLDEDGVRQNVQLGDMTAVECEGAERSYKDYAQANSHMARRFKALRAKLAGGQCVSDLSLDDVMKLWK